MFRFRLGRISGMELAKIIRVEKSVDGEEKFLQFTIYGLQFVR